MRVCAAARARARRTLLELLRVGLGDADEEGDELLRVDEVVRGVDHLGERLHLQVALRLPLGAVDRPLQRVQLGRLRLQLVVEAADPPGDGLAARGAAC